MKQCLNRTQILQLKELGVDLTNVLVSVPPLYFPTLTIGELIDRLPEDILYENGILFICIDKDIIKYWDYNYELNRFRFDSSNELIDNLFDCYVQLIKDEIIKS